MNKAIEKYKSHFCDVSPTSISVWILPKSKKIIVDEIGVGVPVESCGWDNEIKETLKKELNVESNFTITDWATAVRFADELVGESGYEIDYLNEVNLFDDYEEDYEEDEFETALSNCYQMHDGSCGAVGSEYCDWHCPFSK